MAGVSGPSLTAAVARSGGLGLLGAARYTEPQLRKEFGEAQQQADGKGAVGIGLMAFSNTDILDTALDLKPHTLWLSFGDIAPMAERVKAAGIKLMIQVQSVQQALEAVSMGADAIVAQSTESGGHGAGPTGTFCFVPEVVDAVAGNAARTGTPAPPVLAAGGVTDGRQLAAALTLGAAGAVLGTRLVVTEESLYPAHWKERYVASAGANTARTVLFDELGPINWPSGVDGRALRNRFSDANPEHLLAKPEEVARMKADLDRGRDAADPDISPLWCGAGVGLIHSVPPAENVVKEIVEDAAAVIAKLAQQ
ncbi:probable nitronate monooxygenase [Coccomyxa sp. Obi]|nr:probable nitronate monooxygenase [Coccomyxa sp. Obi]